MKSILMKSILMSFGLTLVVVSIGIGTSLAYLNFFVYPDYTKIRLFWEFPYHHIFASVLGLGGMILFSWGCSE